MNTSASFQITLTTPPKGWVHCGDQPQSYESLLDREIFHSGARSGSIRSITNPTGGFGTLMQTAASGEYSGHRVRLISWIRIKDVVDWAGLWFRIDGPHCKMLGFDNMMDRPLKGTLDWAKYEIVLDVPPESVALAYGLLLAGTGQAWIDDVAFEIVSPEVPVTDIYRKRHCARPTNLKFEE